MRITVLMRFPRMERSEWKKTLIDKMGDMDFYVSLVFGESSLWRHLKAALKTYGWTALFKKKKEIEKKGDVNLYSHYSNKLSVHKVKDLNSKKAVRIIRKTEPDYILLLGSGIIRRPVLEIPKQKAVHCHQGFLPSFRGVNTIEWSLLLSSEVHLTTHFVDPGIDTGDILLKKRIVIKKNDSIGTLRRRCQFESVQLILDTFVGLKNKSLVTQKQDKNAGKQYFSMHPFFTRLVQDKIRKMGK